MRISKLRRTLAVFLSMLMITLCVPLTAITASAAVQYQHRVANLNVNQEIKPINTNGDTTYVYEYEDKNENFRCNTVFYFIWKVDEYSSSILSSYSPVTIASGYVGIQLLNTMGGVKTNTSWKVMEISPPKSEITSSSTVKCVFMSDRPQNFEITLDYQNGEPNGSVYTSNDKLPSTLQDPTSEDFIFDGWYTQATGGTKITSTYTFSSDTTIFAHWKHKADKHAWSYSASGNKITANCTQTGCQYYTTGVTLTLNADNQDYSENTAYSGASITKDDDFPGTYTNSDIKYKSADGTTYPESSTAPTKVGSYIASVTAGGATATKAFIINGTDFTGISAENVTATYDGTTAYSITVTGAPADAEISYGTTEGSYSSTNPSFINAGTYTVYYKVTKENFNDKTGSATVTISKAAYPNDTSASANILAGTALTDVTVTLPDIPENMSYGTPEYSGVVTSASISGRTLKFSTNENAAAGNNYTITVPVIGGTGANYVNSTITVTLTAINCTHPNKSSLWSSDADNHWHECPDCHGKSDIAAHTPSADAPTEDSDVHCTVCNYVITQPLDHECARNTPTFVPKVAETCTKDGVKEHYKCRCGKLYSDAGVTNEVTLADLRIPKHSASNGGWEHNDKEHYHVCSVCGEKNTLEAHTFGEWTITEYATATADGTKERTCDICEYVQTGAVKYIPDENDKDTGDINNATDPDTNACHGDTNLTKQEIIEKFGLTPEELTAVENGEDINIILKVTDNSANVSKNDKKLTASVMDVSDNLAMYLDISLYKQVGNNAPTQITNTNGAITIVLEIPEKFINTDSSIKRTYFIIRVHDGKADRIEGTFDAASREFKFSTDKFSSYAIAYTDKAVSTPEPTPTPVPKPVPDTDTTPVLPSHTHVHKLMYDETGHWKQCSCGNKTKVEKHTFGEWEVVKDAAAGESGLEKHTCTVCGYSETAPFEDVAPSAGITAEAENTDTSGRTVIFIALTAFAAVTAAIVLRRKVRK